jgi:transposase
MSKRYWLNDAEWSRLEPLLPRGRRGAHRVDDRRVISGIVHMLRSGARWRDCPAEYGPYTTVYNRFNRWSRQGIWLGMFEAVTGSKAISALARSTARTSRRTARPLAEKGGLQRSDQAIAWGAHNGDPCPERRVRPPAGAAAGTRQPA